MSASFGTEWVWIDLFLLQSWLDIFPETMSSWQERFFLQHTKPIQKSAPHAAENHRCNIWRNGKVLAFREWPHKGPVRGVTVTWQTLVFTFAGDVQMTSNVMEAETNRWPTVLLNFLFQNNDSGTDWNYFCVLLLCLIYTSAALRQK